ncbi:MAG: RNA methyltransferase [Bacteroidales bacterium]|nr:RNA methyltransferase [Bacteroidales bacterium]
MVKLTSAEIKSVKALASKKFRDIEGLFVVEGEKMVAEALESGFKIEKLYRRDEIGEQQMSRISSLDSPSPVLAVIRKAEPKPAVAGKGLFLALDSVRDPGNLGTIMRIADWFGIDGIFASQDTVDQYNPKVVQASMGAVFRKTVVYCDLTALCRSFREAGLPVYGTFLDGSDIYQAELKAEGLIVMGSESFGISKEVGANVDSRIKIPSYSAGPGAESLNVAVATAVTVAEFKRRNA